MATPAPNASAAEAYGVSAGLDLLSGVFGYLTSLSAASAANSRADLMRTEAEANAQRYAEQAAQNEAQEKVMYLSSGVKLSGSPVDALATTARIASENIASIQRAGEIQAADQEFAGTNAEIAGRNAVIGGIGSAFKSRIAGYNALHPGGAPGFGSSGSWAGLSGGAVADSVRGQA